ncbi:MAG: MoxR family ATPase [Gammaproteobacteria bacterium]|nr:MoxR family ATPase [Gammaproteobacteria bacterium]MCW8971940.1 MoxR family ATPase [Gammaproteobacteria bacterium]MCW8992020.1 MoxR family ATPase [Gammaproteobacteria bacterium]
MQPPLQQVIEQAGRFILGKEHPIKLSLACLLARGHLLIEDLPGVGKTTLSHVLAGTLGLEYNRIQFTSDLLPADILGGTVYERDSGAFTFHPGPIFSQLILADEINRATPKTQSAMLEAMEEQQITIEGKSYPLPSPFFVIATQNPTYQIGTFPLPESQLDRFLMVITLGYPAHDAERALLMGRERRDMLQEIKPVIRPEELLALQRQVREVHASESLIDYIQALLAFSRHSPWYLTGLSPRAGLSLLSASRAWALLAGRDHVMPEDVQAILPYVVAHRLQPADDTTVHSAEALVKPFAEVPIP